MTIERRLGVVFVVERLVTVWAAGWRARALAAPIFLELGYALFLQACFVASMAQIFTRRQADWNYVPREHLVLVAVVLTAAAVAGIAHWLVPAMPWAAAVARSMWLFPTPAAPCSASRCSGQSAGRSSQASASALEASSTRSPRAEDGATGSGSRSWRDASGGCTSAGIAQSRPPGTPPAASLRKAGLPE